LEAHRDVLERPAPAAACGRQLRAADERQRLLRVARLARRELASPRGRSFGRRDRELEQKPAAAFGAADDNWSYGSMHRVQLLNNALPKGRLTPAAVVGAMNAAATKDLRANLVPLLAKAMARGAAVSP